MIDIRQVAGGDARLESFDLILESGNATQEFRVAGALFESGLPVLTVPSIGGVYTLPIQIPATKDRPLLVQVYAVLRGLKQNVLSLNVSKAPVREVKPEHMALGFLFDRTPAKPESRLTVVRLEEDATGLKVSLPVEEVNLNQILPGSKDYSKTLAFIYDAPDNTLHTLNDFSSLTNIRLEDTRGPVHGFVENGTVKAQGNIVGYFARFGTRTHRREFVTVYSEGYVTIENLRREVTTRIKLPRSPIVSATETASGYAIIDAWGKVYLYNKSFEKISEYSEHPISSISYDTTVKITRTFKILGRPDLPQDLKYYSLYNESPTKYIIHAHDADNVYTFEGAEVKTIPIEGDNVLYSVGSTTYPSVQTDGKGLLGTVQAPEGIDNIVSVFRSPLGGTEQAVYAAYRNSSPASHLQVNTSSVVSATYTKTVADAYEVTVDVVSEDGYSLFPIEFPEGYTWTAKDLKSSEKVTYVRAGDRVSISIVPPVDRNTSHIFAIGNTSFALEVAPDDNPDRVRFFSGYDQAIGTWYLTNEVTITGVNISIPLQVRLPIESYRVLVNGMPVPNDKNVLLVEGDRLQLEILVRQSVFEVEVSLGRFQTSFGVYTYSELRLEEPKHQAYAFVGREYSQLLVNSGQVPIDLLLTDENQTATFEGGVREFKLLAGQSTQILFTPEENLRYAIKFSTSNYNYQWNIWSDPLYLDAVPEGLKSKRYDTKESILPPMISIPPNFWAQLTIPAGSVFTLNGVVGNIPKDARNLNQDAYTVKSIELSKIALTLSTMPGIASKQILVGSVPIEWKHDFDTVLTYDTEIQEVSKVELARFEHKRSSTYSAMHNKEFQYREDKSQTVHNLAPNGPYIEYDYKVIQSESAGVVQFDLYLGDTKEFDFKADTNVRLALQGPQNAQDTGLTTHELLEFAFRPEEEAASTYIKDPSHRAEGSQAKAELIPILSNSGGSAGQYHPDPKFYGSDRRIQAHSEIVYRHDTPQGNAELHHKKFEENIPSEYEPASQYREAGANVGVNATGSDFVHPEIIGAAASGHKQFLSIAEASEILSSQNGSTAQNFGERDIVMIDQTSTLTSVAARVALMPVQNVDKDTAKGSMNESFNVQYMHAKESLTPSSTQAFAFSSNIAGTEYAEIQSYGFERMSFEAPYVNFEDEMGDLLLRGYFGSELDALQDAVVNWGYDPSLIYAIKQPNGYYTWAQTTLCKDLCASTSCSTRGYISGG